MISLIAAVTQNRVIGKNNTFPWRISSDLKYFKKVTLGKPCIMGRKTFDSIGKPLPGRLNLVISRQADLKIEGAQVFPDLNSALHASASLVGEGKEIMVIGGAQIFAEALPYADRIFLTEVHADIEGDVFFPPLNPSEWKEVSREFHQAQPGETADYSFVVLERIYPRPNPLPQERES